jgi:hypothetical protein
MRLRGEAAERHRGASSIQQCTAVAGVPALPETRRGSLAPNADFANVRMRVGVFAPPPSGHTVDVNIVKSEPYMHTLITSRS